MSKQNKIIMEGITYDDVLMLPAYSGFKRNEVALTVKLHQKINLNLPVISSPMDKVTEAEMAISIALAGGLGIIHRNININDQAELVSKVKSYKITDSQTATVDKNGRLIVGAAVGAGSDLEERLEALNKVAVDLICVDSGHGHSKFIIDAVKLIKKNFPDMVIMAGNVATYDGAKALIDAGSNILRVGVGPGSICTTRIISGMGVPQLTAVIESVKAVEGTDVTVIADGGIKQTGDMAKALGFGAHAVMLGSLLAGHDEAPGETLEVEGEKYKIYRGMGSLGAMVKGGAERYGQDPKEIKDKLIPEGVEGLVKYKGKVEDYLYQVSGSLKSAFYYVGAKNLTDFHSNAKFVKITSASMAESHPHSIKITGTGKNYNIS